MLLTPWGKFGRGVGGRVVKMVFTFCAVNTLGRIWKGEVVKTISTLGQVWKGVVVKMMFTFCAVITLGQIWKGRVVNFFFTFCAAVLCCCY